MRPRLRFLDDGLVDRILDEARDLLATVGVEVHNRLFDVLGNPTHELLKEGHLLIADHTRRHRREEIHLPGPVIERASYGRWREEGEATLASRAGDEVERLIGAWTPSRVPDSAKRALQERMGAAARAAGLDALPFVEP